MRHSLTLMAVLALASPAVHAQTVVKIGAAAPLSGPGAHQGKDIENGAQMAIDDLNAQGAVIGDTKIQWLLQAEDDASDPKQGTAVAQKLVDAGVAGVVGHLNSGTTVPASKIYHGAGIPQISPAATTPLYTHQGMETAFRIVANDHLVGLALARYSIKTLKAARIAVIDDRTAFGQGLADEYIQGVKSIGGAQIVSRQFTSRQAKSAQPERYLPALAKISYQGITGAIRFDAKGDLRGAALTLFTYRQGKKTKLAVVR
ncbi:branched-chain amino acid ABC transporter substrate-binding protein [Duganella sp. BuS-21]|uniref:branched-chain amino acid ABC transporter substrate-binding protein n=1 Tax=Duganella sp. BuS-21 TaxID=2943848 RepID=UPI0035A60C73